MNSHFLIAHDVYALRSTHPEVRRLKRQNSHHTAHGNKVWRSSFVLMDYFLSQPLPDEAKVLDLGCGWGLTGIYLAKQFKAQVTGVDIDPGVEPFLQLQAEINHCHIDFKTQDFRRISTRELATFHTLAGTDICFWDDMTQILFNLIRRAKKAGVKQILIADPGRPPFWALVERCASSWGSRYESRRIEQPFKTSKYILRVDLND